MSSDSYSPSVPPSAGIVLVVDDVAANVRLLSGILRLSDYDVVTASNGVEALQRIEEHSPDVVLLDVMMPEMDGFEVCRRIRENPATQALPVVIVTALHETDDRVRAIEAGADDFLTKPVNEVEVVARVRSLVRVKRGRDELERAYTDLKRAESLRDSLATMLVHDLRTPLTTLIGPLEMMQSQQFGELTDTQLQIVAMSTRSGQRLLHLVNELLDVAKMEEGHIALQQCDVELPKVVNEALEFVSGVHSGNTERVTRNFADDLPVICADEDLLRRVLVNLLGNAIKFSPDDKNIEVGIRQHEEENEILIWVRDEGEGIPPQYHDKIFEKFGQVEMRQAGRKFSSGLGLTFCKLAVEAHGGRIWLESQVGQGTTFFFTLPKVLAGTTESTDKRPQ